MPIKKTKKSTHLNQKTRQALQCIEARAEIRKLTIVEELVRFMKMSGINRSQLAKRMGVPPSRITKLLSGESNLTIDTLVRAADAVDGDLAQAIIPKGQRGHWVAAQPNKGISGSPCLKVFFSKPSPVHDAPAPRLNVQTPASRDVDSAA
ncbi:MAG: helix-turn-helix transcriptional regulator [Opitutales bacterium]